jgi:hypothetical protein
MRRTVGHPARGRCEFHGDGLALAGVYAEKCNRCVVEGDPALLVVLVSFSQVSTPSWPMLVRIEMTALSRSPGQTAARTARRAAHRSSWPAIRACPMPDRETPRSRLRRPVRERVDLGRAGRSRRLGLVERVDADPAPPNGAGQRALMQPCTCRIDEFASGRHVCRRHLSSHSCGSSVR